MDVLSGQLLSRLGMSQPYLVFVRGQWWRIGTAIFLHAGLVHILFNMYALYVTGTLLEEAWGRTRFVAGFLLTGLFASVFSGFMRLVTEPIPDALRSPGSVGASGAIFGLFGALGVALYRRRGTPWGRSMFSQIVVIVLINLVLGFTVPGIDAWAHLGGLLAGLVIGAGFDASPYNPSRNSLAIASATFVSLVTALMAATAVGLVGRA